MDLVSGKAKNCRLNVAQSFEASFNKDCEWPQWPRLQVSTEVVSTVGGLQW